VRPLTQKWARQGKATLPCQFFLAKKVMYGTQACAYHTLLGYLLQSSQSSFDFTMLACSGASSPAWPRAGASVPQRCTCRSRTRLGWRVCASKDNKEGDRGMDWDGAWERFKSTAAKGAQSLFISLCCPYVCCS